MFSVKQIADRFAELHGQVVEVVAPCAYSLGQDRAQWLYDELEDYSAAGTRLRLRPGEDRHKHHLFTELLVGGHERQQVIKHAATAIVCGRVERSGDPRFVAELVDLQWATLSFPAQPANLSPWPGPWEQRYPLGGLHPRLDQGISVSRLLRMRDEWRAKRVRVWGYLILPDFDDDGVPLPDAVLVEDPQDHDDPTRCVRLERQSLRDEKHCIYSSEGTFRVPEALVARCILTGVVGPRPLPKTAVVLRTTTELCLAPAVHSGVMPPGFHAFGDSSTDWSGHYNPVLEA